MLLVKLIFSVLHASRCYRALIMLVELHMEPQQAKAHQASKVFFVRIVCTHCSGNCGHGFFTSSPARFDFDGEFNNVQP